MEEDDVERAELAAVVEADLRMSGARTVDEFTLAAMASVRSLLPDETSEIVVEMVPTQPPQLTVWVTRARRST